jgi:hypothetical protein
MQLHAIVVQIVLINREDSGEAPDHPTSPPSLR